MGGATTGNAYAAAMNTRLVFSAAALPSKQARAIVALMCKTVSVHPMESKRARLAKHFHRATVRVLKFAKYETLRKLHRHLYSHQPLSGQEQHHDSLKIAFDVGALSQDFNSMLRTEIPTVLDAGAQDTLDAVGYRDPWELPSQDALDFIAQRENLLSGVPDDIYAEIQAEISDGLNAGESYDEIAQRISDTFDQIEEDRALVIAETETAAAYGYASDEASRAAGIQYKKWLHGATSKVPRPDHLEIDGLVVPFEEAFPVGDPPLMYPHDDNGSPEDVINCSCIAIPATEEDYQAQ